MLTFNRRSLLRSLSGAALGLPSYRMAGATPIDAHGSIDYPVLPATTVDNVVYPDQGWGPGADAPGPDIPTVPFVRGRGRRPPAATTARTCPPCRSSCWPHGPSGQPRP